jgi:hypothetical protein
VIEYLLALVSCLPSLQRGNSAVRVGKYTGYGCFALLSFPCLSVLSSFFVFVLFLLCCFADLSPLGFSDRLKWARECWRGGGRESVGGEVGYS